MLRLNFQTFTHAFDSKKPDPDLKFLRRVIDIATLLRGKFDENTLKIVKFILHSSFR